LIGNARERRIEHLRMNCHPQNREMQALARRFRADIKIYRVGNVGRINTKNPAPRDFVSPDEVPNPA
jgi:hypothetical protein